MSNVTKIHTTACGTEPFDKNFGVGAQKHLVSGGYSPYPRIEKLRKLFRETPLTLYSTRALDITDIYKNNEGLPPIIKKAMVTKRFTGHCPLSYIEGELLLTDDGSPIYGHNLFPEIVNWYYNELRNQPLYEREWNPLFYDEKTKEEILSIEEYWKGKNIKEIFISRLPETASKGCAATGGMLVINPSVNVNNGVGHVTPNYEYVLQRGIGGMKADVQAYLDKLGTPVTLDGFKAMNLYKAELIVLDAFSNFLLRYAAFAKEEMAKYESQQTKDELQHMSEICEYLGNGGAPRDFWEAVQLVYTTHVLNVTECNGNAFALGRMDQYLYPYYKADLEKGTYTKDFMLEIIEYLYLKLETHGSICQDEGKGMWRGGSRGWSGMALIVGGVDAEGNDVTNDLSFMFMDAMLHVRTVSPFITVRYHKNMPYELKVKAAELVRAGLGHPKFLNDNVCIEALMRYGVPLEEARNYVNIGCVELEVPGKTCGWHDTCYVTLPKILELALNNGRCLDCTGESCPIYDKCVGSNDTLGLKTGYLKDFKTFDEVIAAFEAQLKYWCDRAVLAINVLQDIHATMDDYPLLSLLIDDCNQKGKSFMWGGARYNYAGLQGLGPATTADSLTALKKLVYEDQKVTPEEFYDALVNNWQGHERLYQLVNSDKVPHYGNDDDYADEMMKYVYDTYHKTLASYPPARGIHQIRSGTFSQVINVIFGGACGATPDGRKHHEAISANIDPARTAAGHRDRHGPTALAKSIGKLDHTQAACGTLVNMKFGVDTMSGKQGLENFVDFLDAYFEDDPMHVQFMVADRDTLIDAQKHPEEYQDLMVRVSGFSAYFHILCKEFQDELINRTEHTLD